MTSPKGPAPWLKGFGAMGDSFTNRYNGRDDNPYNLNWVEQLVSLRNLPFGTVANPYAYDVVPGGGNTDSVDAATRQAPALVPLVTAGQVNLVSLELGSHDFGPIAADKAYAKIYQSTTDTYDDIYQGRLKGPILDAYIDAVLGQLISAVTQVQGAGAKVIVANIPDFGDCHYVRLGSTSPPYPPHPDPAKRRLVTKAVNAANRKLRQVTRKQGMPLLDLKGLIDLSVGRAPVVVGGLALDRDPCPYPTQTNHFWLDAQHPGTIISGLFANMVVATANASFKAGITPLSDQEILRIAGLPGLAPPTAKATFFDVGAFVLG